MSARENLKQKEKQATKVESWKQFIK